MKQSLSQELTTRAAKVCAYSIQMALEVFGDLETEVRRGEGFMNVIRKQIVVLIASVKGFVREIAV